MHTTPKSPFRLADLLASLAVLSGVGYLATAYSVSRYLTRTTRGLPDLPPPWDHCTCETLECRTADNLRLVGWLFTPPQPRATVALFHGFRRNRSNTLDRIALLTKAGYRCVAFDHRGHGQSEGKVTSFGFHEGRDVAAVLDLVDRHWPDQPRAALGISMGAAALAYAAPTSRRFDAVILESLYHDLNAAFRNRVGRDFPQWFHHFIKGTIWITERRLGLKMPEMVPCNFVHQLESTPKLLITGSDDEHATPDEVQQIYDRCQEPREFRVITGATHTDVCETGGELYRDMILDFLDRRLFAKQLPNQAA